MKIAVTGGTGFVGADLIEQLLEQGWEVKALARDPKKIAAGNAVAIVKGDLDNEAALREIAEGADAFLHLAGATHAKKAQDYHRVNVEGAQRAAKAAAEAGAKFVLVSSMSARAPHVSPYAASKHASERAVAETSQDNPWLALRLPAIYGPGDLVALPLFKMARAGFAPEPKTETPARASILHVSDASSAIIAAARQAEPGHVYEVGDDRREGYAWSEIGAALGEIYGNKPRSIRVPRSIIAAYYAVLRRAEAAIGRNPSVREGQVNEFFHPDWVARDNLFNERVGWAPKTPLKEGFAKTIRWYQENGLL